MNSFCTDLYYLIAPGVLNIKEMKSLFIFASMTLKAAILSFENLQHWTLFCMVGTNLHKLNISKACKRKLIISQLNIRKWQYFIFMKLQCDFLFIKTNDKYIFSVFSEEEPDLNSELEISVRNHKNRYLTKIQVWNPLSTDHRDCWSYCVSTTGEAANSKNDGKFRLRVSWLHMSRQ